MPASAHQNTVILEAAGAAVGAYARGGCTVVCEGVLGPWLLGPFAVGAGRAALNYAVLLPPVETCLERVASRSGHGFADPAATRQMHAAFAAAGIEARHVVADPALAPAAVAAEVLRRLRAGSLRAPVFDQPAADRPGDRPTGPSTCTHVPGPEPLLASRPVDHRSDEGALMDTNPTAPAPHRRVRGRVLGRPVHGRLAYIWACGTRRCPHEKGYYLAILVLGLFAAVSLQKSVRDRTEDIPVTGLTRARLDRGGAASIVLLTVGLWNRGARGQREGLLRRCRIVLSLFVGRRGPEERPRPRPRPPRRGGSAGPRHVRLTDPDASQGATTNRRSPSPSRPAGVTTTARSAGVRCSHPRSRSSRHSAAPRAPPRWWRRSVRSRHARTRGRPREWANGASRRGPRTSPGPAP